MSLETPPPPPPPPPSDGDANSQAPKLKLNKPAGAVIPPPPSAGAIPPPPPAGAMPRPPVVGATGSAPRVAPIISSTPSSNVTTLEASFDILGMIASTAAFVFLLIELFIKTKG